ncbi:hypothetical protein SETIT_4G021000v2 [Setaria italica]|uniref:Uncharacterized protein n=1 Tax=Setaria italica TaxID=4555 RepID=A0A368QPV2_SETIT|nr:uncharacterized protein LOC101757424 [Setaria italica]RCV20006.1 hypothetical protein SETIT_4G021000v2 [Setaria italica]
MAASVEKRLVPMMAFCELPFDGTLDGTTAASSSPASRGGGGPRPRLRQSLELKQAHQNRILSPMAATVEKRLVPMMAFCETPFDGTLDGTTAASSSPTSRGGATSASSSGDAAATRRAMLAAVAKEFPLTSQRREQAQQQRGGAVHGMTVLETIVME